MLNLAKFKEYVEKYAEVIVFWTALSFLISFLLGYIVKQVLLGAGVSIQEYIGIWVYCLRITVVLALVSTVLTFMRLILENVSSIFPMLVSISAIALTLMSKVYFDIPDSVFYPLIYCHCLVNLIMVCLPLLLERDSGIDTK